MTIQELWNQACNRYAERECLSVFEGQTWTYSQLDSRVRALSRYWAETGVEAGDKVALYAANQNAWGAVYLSLAASGRVVVPILPDFHAREVGHVLHHAGVKALVVGRSLVDSWNAGQGEIHEDELDSVRGVRVLVLEDFVEGVGEAESGSADTQAPSVCQTVRPSDLAAILYTSGTTGASKGVMLSHSNIVSNVIDASPRSTLVAGDSMLSVLPLAHTYECTLGFLLPLGLGANVTYLSKPPAPAVLLPALAKVRPHAILTVPLLMEKIYRQRIAPKFDKPIVKLLCAVPGVRSALYHAASKRLQATFGGRVRFFGIGGAPLAPDVETFLSIGKFPYAIGYGLTETSPLVAGALGSRCHTTGPVLTNVEVKIGEPKNDSGAGEVLVRGPNVMMGYYRDEERTAEVLSADGWFKTGDLGYFDEQGNLALRGRSKNVILGPNGENIYPEAIEALINQDLRVVESLVVQRGKEIVAKVVLNDEHLVAWASKHGHAIADDVSHLIDDILKTIHAEINQKLNRFSKLSFVEEQKTPFEKTATLKIKRFLYA